MHITANRILSRTLEGKPLRYKLPANSIDCHMHVYDSCRYQGHPNSPPPPPDALVTHYEKVQKWLGCSRVVVIQGNAYHKDNKGVLDALSYFKESARGVVAIDADVTESDLADMTKMGVRAARIMDILQGAVGMQEMLAVNARVRSFGWHLIVQFDGGRILEYMPVLEQIQGQYIIDHLGKFLTPVRVESPEVKALFRLIDRGNCYVKIAGFYETSQTGFPEYSDVAVLVNALIQYAPERLIWGSNWPHNMAKTTETYPDDGHLLDLVCTWIKDPLLRQQIFVDTPEKLYGFQSIDPSISMF